MPTMAFEYFEIRPCIKIKGDVTSYVDELEFTLERDRLTGMKLKRRISFKAFWTLYGRYADDNGDLLAKAIGDFADKDAAFSVLNAILAPLAQARDELLDADRYFDIDQPKLRRAYLTAVADVMNALTDVIAQSSDRERL